jgi:flagellar secretion chaperone FliS
VNSKLATYRSVYVHGGVAGADPHGLVLMLMNGVMERLATARGCIERRDIVSKAKLLHSCVTLVAELRGSLNLTQGGPLAQNLDDLYDYMTRRLLLANAEDNISCITEVERLLGEIRSGWIGIGPEVRKTTQPTVHDAA